MRENNSFLAISTRQDIILFWKSDYATRDLLDRTREKIHCYTTISKQNQSYALSTTCLFQIYIIHVSSTINSFTINVCVPKCLLLCAVFVRLRCNPQISVSLVSTLHTVLAARVIISLSTAAAPQ